MRGLLVAPPWFRPFRPCPGREDFPSTLEEHVTNQQQDQAQSQASATPQANRDRREFAKKGAITVVGALVSGAARAVVAHLLTGE